MPAFNTMLFNQKWAVGNTWEAIDHNLRVQVITAQYRLVKVITSQHRLIKVITAMYRKVRIITTGG